ncbi:MAG: GumC family protein [Candidatus Methylumidiphilus sp.]
MNAPGNASPDPPNVPSGALMPLVSLRRNWRIGLAVMLVVAVAGLAAAWKKKGKYVYGTTATIYVAPRFVNVLQDSKDLELPSYQQFRQFVEHQAQTVKRFDIVLDALKRMGERRKVWQRPNETEEDAAGRLMGTLKVVAIKDTYLITVNLESDNPDGLDELVNTVVATFMDKVRLDEFFYARDDRLKALRERRDALLKNVAERIAERTQIAQTLGVTTFSETSPNPFDQLLVEGQTALALAQRERIAAESNLAVFVDERGRVNQAALDAATFEIVAKDPGLTSLWGNAYTRRDALLAQASGLEDANPLKIKIDRQLQELQAQVDETIAAATAKVGKALLEQRKSELAKVRRIEQDIAAQIEAHRQKATWFASLYNKALSLGGEIERSRKQLDAIGNRVDYFDLESQAPGFLRLESPARPAGQPLSGGGKKVATMSVVASIVLGLLVPIIWDMRDRSIKTTNQVQKLLGYPPLAGLLELSEDIAVRRAIADQRRRLAIALEREHQTRGVRLFLLTSVKPAAGVTGLAFDLAMEFADLGLKALVVEVNALKPDPRYADRFQAGLLDLIIGDGNVAAAINPATGQLPDRIGVGLPVRPHLFAFPKVREIFDSLKSRYDLILLDAPPVPLSADAEFLAGIADLTLLLIGAGQVLPGELRRSVGILQKADPPAVSFIVTHLQIYQGGGYFSGMVQAYSQAEADATQAIRNRPSA